MRAAGTSLHLPAMSLLASGWLLLAMAPDRAWGQDPHAGMPGMDEARPALNIHGFSDVTYVASGDSNLSRGFQLGQFVVHFSSSLARKASYFGEISGTPSADKFNFEVERSFVRYDYNDGLKLSFGRYHTPIGYWNTAFHHGLWLQTTVRRPEQVRLGGIFVPVHFVGLKAEGDIPSGRAGLGYEVGVGNGRSEILSRGGDAGDVNTNRAWLVGLQAHPIVPLGLKAGATVYRDRLSLAAQPAIDEWIVSGYAAWTREAPELIAELITVRHRDHATGADFDSKGFYVQGAYRLPGRAHPAKLYARYEELDVPAGEPVFAFPDLQVVITGVRFDFLSLAAFKAEYRNELSPGRPRAHALFLQTSYTF